MAEPIREWEFTWRGIANGARISSACIVREYGRTESEARMKVLERYPSIIALSNGVEVMMAEHWTSRLAALGACSEAITWAREYRSVQAAWDACDRGDWMLWLLGRLAGDSESQSRRDLVLIACACAKPALRHLPAEETRPHTAIRCAEKWAFGDSSISLDDVGAAADAASAAADAASAAAAYDAAAYDAASAAVSAYDAASAANASAAADAASAAAAYAAYAASAAAAYAARRKSRAKSATIVRKMHPRAPRLPRVASDG